MSITLTSNQAADMLDNEDLTLIFLAQHGDEESMLSLISKYAPAIKRAAGRYADEFGLEDCYAEARCAFIERVFNADPSNLKRFRTMLTKELSDVVMTRLNLHGLSRRAIADNPNLPEYVQMSEEVKEMPYVTDHDVKLSEAVIEAIEAHLTDEERKAVIAYTEYPRMTEAQVAEECGMTRSTYQRRLATAFAKLREVL